ncbi:MAG: PEP-CTERM sorting domain-containing protein [Kiloniellaceae bacterium]
MTMCKTLGEAMLVLVVLAAGMADARATVYSFSGTCDSDCLFVGLVDGAAVSGAVKVNGSGALTTANFTAIDLSIGDADILDTANPVGDGRVITATTSGSTFSDIMIAQPTGGGGFSDVFFMPTSSGADWEFSLSAAPLPPAGSGAWTRETDAFYDFAGTCLVNCDFVGLAAGEAVSASVKVAGVGARTAIYFESVDLAIGTFGLLDSTNPFADGREITANVSATTINDFFIGLPIMSGFSDVFFTPGTGGTGWELSASSLPNAVQGDGAWTRRPKIGGGGGGPGTGAIPEPASLMLFFLGLVGLGALRWRMKAT